MTTNHIFVFNSICPLLILYHPIIFLVPSPYVAHMCSYISMLHFVPILPTYIYFPSFLFSCASYTCASPAAARQFWFNFFFPILFVWLLCPQLPNIPQATITRVLLWKLWGVSSPLKYSPVTVTDITTVVQKWKAQNWTCWLIRVILLINTMSKLHQMLC